MNARMTFEHMVRTLQRMTMLPGADRMNEQAWVEYYRHLAQYFPHELDRAVTELLGSPHTEFFPAPGKIVDSMGRHRRLLGGDWDTVHAALQIEAEGGTPSGYIEPVKEDRAAAESRAAEFFSDNPGLLK